MEKKQAMMVSNYLERWNESTSTTYELNKLDTFNDTLTQFHQWANGKPIISAFEVAKLGQDSYFFLFIDWHRNDNYYLVIYAHDKSTTIAELNRTIDEDGATLLSWKYNPLKRDGKNYIRKSYFKQTFGTTTMTIPLPTSILNTETFLDQIYKLCHNRIRADRIVEIFEPT
ncbi:hypothetical protein [Paenisporosarcina antarctica]|uniref:Uncharacterized protein n=1 Tax=Paenisporosarcina antarctica TaxID=417367 RepID=A0A4P7A091_9BACL|nr:hypothetical protein [Paenisporosarcina antarctica]QBP41988.1 hypothetical protein E2636_12870 [Paenisporosarcina antarctica]